MRPLRATGQRVVAFCRDHYSRTGNTPSYSMIRDEIGAADNAAVKKILKRAEARGHLALDGEYRGGRGPRCGQRIRFGLPEEADTRRIRFGSDVSELGDR